MCVCVCVYVCVGVYSRVGEGGRCEEKGERLCIDKSVDKKARKGGLGE